MVRARLAALIVCWSALLVAGPALATQPPISSKAELTRYLQNTPAGSSPLDALSRGGRKRFLASLEFGDRGLRNISLDDPRNELTEAQIVQLFTLFGAAPYATGEGLTSAEQSRRERERASDAASRGCAVKACPESTIEQHYDKLVLHPPDNSLSAGERATLTGERYDRLFSTYQSAQHLHRVNPVDLRLLRRAAEFAVYSTASPAHIAHLQLDLTEMQRRDMLTDKDYVPLHDALIAARDFAAAGELAKRHPDMGIAPVPTYRKPPALPAGQPTALSIDAHNATMVREPFDLSDPVHIVVVASCHFSRDAARAITADAQLRSLFARDATWLASQNESFDAVRDWNHEFPDQPIHVAWQNSEWPMLDSWAMPTFYVFRHGQLVEKFSGWYDLPTLKQSLREAGVLR